MRPELESYIRHYIKRVIRLNIPIEDSPEPCAVYKPKQILHLPMSEETLGQFLGEEFVKNASKELLFSIVVGLAYHESAHLLSGEDNDTKPEVLNNLISDSNDFTFIPQTWPGSIPFTLSLVNTTYQQSTDLKDMPLKTKNQKLAALIGMAVEFMRKRRIKFKGKDIRSLPADHPLQEPFNEIKPIVKEARKTEVEDRPALVKRLFEVLKEYWTEQQKQQQSANGKGNKGQSTQPSKSTSSELTPEMVAMISKSERVGNRKLNKSDATKLQKLAEKSGVLDKYKEAMKRVEKDIEKEAIERMHSCIERPYGLEEQKEVAPYTPAIDDSIVASVRNTLRPILFQRTIKRMAPSVVGERFCPSHFHEIKTNPEEPRIRKEVKRIARIIDETSIILCFDRSGSMVEFEKEKVTIQIASTLYKALSTIPRVRVQMLGFNDVPQLIKGRRPVSLDTVLRRIPIGLRADGGTDFPLALKESLRLAKETQAHKKLVIILTDGDITGELPIQDLLHYAGTYRIQVVVIGVEGSNEWELREYFGRRAIYVERTQELPRKLKEVTLSNA